MSEYTPIFDHTVTDCVSNIKLQDSQTSAVHRWLVIKLKSVKLCAACRECLILWSSDLSPAGVFSKGSRSTNIHEIMLKLINHVCVLCVNEETHLHEVSVEKIQLMHVLHSTGVLMEVKNRERVTCLGLYEGKPCRQNSDFMYEPEEESMQCTWEKTILWSVRGLWKPQTAG